MRTLKDLKLVPVWVNPDHLVITAVHLLRSHELRALSVLDGKELVGIVTFDALAGICDHKLVREVMLPPPIVLSSAVPIRKVADSLIQRNVDYVPVMDGDRFHGIVTATMLLKELARSWDPLTNLSWSDALRDWGMERLSAGHEITILFIDLDDFGQFNKRYGHIVGDRILRAAAQLMREKINSETDILVRYGGDEFAIGTTRHRILAEELAESLTREMDQMEVEDVPVNVHFTIGIYGGQRNKERENVHVGATLDSLINLASRDCIQKKKKRSLERALQSNSVAETPEPEAVPKTPEVAPVLIMVSADNLSPHAPTTVGIHFGNAIFTGVDLRGTRPITESVATATARSIERAFPGTQVHIDDIVLSEMPGGEKLISISGRVSLNGSERPIASMDRVGEDLFRSVAQTTLNAYLSVKSNHSAE